MTKQDRSPSRFENRWHKRGLPSYNQIANAASILGVVITGFAAFRLDSTIIPIIYICLLSAFLLVRYLRQLRWANYAEAIVVAERAFRELQQAVEFAMFEDNPDAAWLSLQHSLSSLATAFTVVSGMPCRVALAELVIDDDMAAHAAETGGNPQEALYVQVLVRSNDGQHHANKRQKLVANTDFFEVTQTERPFFSNDLVRAYKQRKYENSNWTAEMVENGGVDYRSAIVWPVEISIKAPIGQEKAPMPRAFLCLDAPRADGFVRVTDIPFGASYAHALYPLARQLLGPSNRR